MSSFNLPSYEEIIESPYSSNWLKKSLRDALDLDPIEAMREAIILSEVMKQRVIDFKNRRYEKVIKMKDYIKY